MEMHYERSRDGIHFESVSAGDIMNVMERRGFKTKLVFTDLDNGMERHAEGYLYRATKDSVKAHAKYVEEAKKKRRDREERRSSRED